MTQQSVEQMTTAMMRPTAEQVLNEVLEKMERDPTAIQDIHELEQMGVPKAKVEEIVRLLGPLSPPARKRVVKALMKKWDEERQQLIGNLATTKVEAANIDRKIESFDQLSDWVIRTQLVLQRNDCSRLHKLKLALKEGRVISPKDGTITAPELNTLASIEHTFVVKHDWAGAFANAEGLSDDFRIPYDHCTFEFRMGGHTVIIACRGDYLPPFNCLHQNPGT